MTISTEGTTHRDNNRVAAIIPTYQRASLVGRAVDSALAQDPKPEVIVVNDGSTDDTSAVLARFGDQIIVVNIANSGLAAARNVGAATTNAKWLAFLDSDDYWSPGHISRLVAAMNATSGRAVVYFADTQRTESEGSISQFERSSFHPDSPWEAISDGTNWVLMPYQPLMIVSSMIDHDEYDSVGGTWEELSTAEDTHLFFNLGIGRTMCAVNGIGCIVTDDDDSGLRLSDTHTRDNEAYLHTLVQLYGDILSRHGRHLGRLGRRDIRQRIAHTKIYLARVAFPSHPIVAARALASAAMCSPVALAQQLQRRFAGLSNSGGGEGVE